MIKTAELILTEGKVKGFHGKNLIDLDNGGLKMVKVDAFASYPTHLHPEKTEFVYVLEGNPEISIGDKVYQSEPGDFITLPKSIEHSIANRTEKECKLLVGAITD